VIVLSDGEVADDVVVALLGVGEGEAGVDLQRLAGGVAAVGLDERLWLVWLRAAVISLRLTVVAPGPCSRAA